MRAAKVLVLLSTLAALWLQAYLGGLAYPWLPAVALGSVAAGVMLSAAVPAAPGIVVGLGAIVPVVMLSLVGRFELALWVPWLSIVTGVMLRQSLSRGWFVPDRWRWPIVCWAVGIALTWPILIGREMDFHREVLWLDRVWTSRQGAPPKIAALWIAQSASILLISLLWLDSLCGRYRDRASAFGETLVWPLAGGVLLSNVPALVQGFYDIGFLNRTVFGATGRASGAMLDGNAFGMMAAAVVPLTLSITFRTSQRPVVRWLGAVGALLLAAGVWATASRTALMAMLVGTAIVMWRPLMRIPLQRRLAAAGAAIVSVVLAVIFVPQVTVGPMSRVRELLPGLSSSQLMHAGSELWNRGNYGASALMMVKEHPLAGVGVGGFNMFVPDYSFRTNVFVPSDNAQNWYRHELAELGVFGSVAWLAFLWAVAVSWRRAAVDDLQRGARAAVAAVALASLLGMPTQNPVMSVTFVSLLFAAVVWRQPDDGRRPVSRRALQLLLVISTTVFIAATSWESARGLRPFMRASVGNWPYEYGLYPVETRGDGSRFRWTEGRAVVTVPFGGPFLKLTILGAAPDAATRPVRVRLWRGSSLVVDMLRSDDAPFDVYLHADNGRGVPLRIEVERTWEEPAGLAGQRHLGVSIGDWAWVRQPPATARFVK